jgi:mannitol-specific phosphotransferase system IIBC component
VRDTLNGKTGEIVRWALGLCLAALVSYFTAIGTLQTEVAVLKERYERIAEDVREVKADVKLLLQRVR